MGRRSLLVWSRMVPLSTGYASSSASGTALCVAAPSSKTLTSWKCRPVCRGEPGARPVPIRDVGLGLTWRTVPTLTERSGSRLDFCVASQLPLGEERLVEGQHVLRPSKTYYGILFASIRRIWEGRPWQSTKKNMSRRRL